MLVIMRGLCRVVLILGSFHIRVIILGCVRVSRTDGCTIINAFILAGRGK